MIISDVINNKTDSPKSPSYWYVLIDRMVAMLSALPYSILLFECDEPSEHHGNPTGEEMKPSAV
eukprot:scaffold381105_cov39-Prasinocladus_malaysianus.AAC.1